MGEWYTLKYEITSETTGAFFVAKRGETLEKVGDFTYTVSGGSLKNGQVAFSTANVAEPSFDIDNFVVKHSGGTTTETFDSANSIADTVFSTVSVSSVEVDPPVSTGKLLVNSGKYFKRVAGGNGLNQENAFIRTRKIFSEITSVSYNLRIKSGAGWSTITMHNSNVYAGPIFIYNDHIEPYGGGSLFNVDGESVNRLSVDFGSWTTIKLVPLGVATDGSESADIFVGAVNGTLTKIGYLKVYSDKLAGCPVSSGSPTFTTNSCTGSGEVNVANITVTYKENDEDKVVTENFTEDYVLQSNGHIDWEHVFTIKYDNEAFYLSEFSSATDYAVTGNIIAKDAIAGGSGMTDDSAIIGVYKVKYINGSGKFDITFNYGGNGVYGERIAIENGKLTYYTGETAGVVKEFTAEDGAEITLEIRLYKSGAISVKVNDENGVTTLRNSGEFGSFAIFATDGITKVTSVKATQYHIPKQNSDSNG